MSKVLKIGLVGNLDFSFQIETIESSFKEKEIVYSTQKIGDGEVSSSLVVDALHNKDFDVVLFDFQFASELKAPELSEAICLPRCDYRDSLVHKEDTSFYFNENSTPIVFCREKRQKAQWLNRFPNSQITVTEQLPFDDEEKKWDGCIVSGCVVKGIEEDKKFTLNWMLPRPCSGFFGLLTRKDNDEINSLVSELNDYNTFVSFIVERDFVQNLPKIEGIAVGALAFIKKHRISIQTAISSEDGVHRLFLDKSCKIDDYASLGQKMAMKAIKKGIENLKNS